MLDLTSSFNTIERKKIQQKMKNVEMGWDRESFGHREKQKDEKPSMTDKMTWLDKMTSRAANGHAEVNMTIDKMLK